MGCRFVVEALFLMRASGRKTDPYGDNQKSKGKKQIPFGDDNQKSNDNDGNDDDGSGDDGR
jgi:hypothetical protein